MDARKVALGGLLLFVSSVTFMGTGLMASRTPLVVAAAASLGLSAASLLVGDHPA